MYGIPVPQLQNLIDSPHFAELIAYDRLTGELRLSDTIMAPQNTNWAAEVERQAKEKLNRGSAR